MNAQTQPRSLFFLSVNMACRAHLPALLAAWLPDGRKIGQEWVSLNPTRADRHAGSFKVNTVSGCWADFATGETGGDPVSLFAYLNGMSQGQAAHTLINKWGMR